MAHSDDATQTWIKAIPETNADGNVVRWSCEYKYVLNSYTKIFAQRVLIDSPSKTPSSYTKTELLNLLDKPHMDAMFNKKYAESIKDVPVITTDTDFDVSTLSDS